MPKDIYRRHDNCKCSVEYDPGKGRKRQAVHSGTEGKRRYVKDKYGDYELTKEARVAHSKEMAATAEERAKAAREKRIETWRQKKLPAAQDDRQGVHDAVEKHTQAENVMPEYLRNATPGVGSVTYDNGYDMIRHAPEIKTAQWLHDNLGGDIVLLQERNVKNVKTPDYIWRGKKWDEKTSSSEKSASSAIRHGLKQIEGNPGGIVLNFEQKDISVGALRNIIDKRMNWYSLDNKIDILVISNNNLVIALRY